MSGAAIADAAGLGSVLVPAMKKRGYDEKFALGLTGASSLIGPIMPPSIPAIVYAVSAGVSVGALFFAGVIPALVLTLILCFFRLSLRLQKSMPEEEVNDQVIPLFRALRLALPVLLTVIILGGILGGIFTPTKLRLRLLFGYSFYVFFTDPFPSNLLTMFWLGLPQLLVQSCSSSPQQVCSVGSLLASKAHRQ